MTAAINFRIGGDLGQQRCPDLKWLLRQSVSKPRISAEPPSRPSISRSALRIGRIRFRSDDVSSANESDRSTRFHGVDRQKLPERDIVARGSDVSDRTDGELQLGVIAKANCPVRPSL